MPYVRPDHREVELYYEVAGQGPRLLFISGTGSDLRVSPNVFDGPLPRHFQVLAFDQRGLGRSSKPPGPYSMVGYADDAAGLMEALGWEDAAVLGVSFGGMVAQELALRHPERLRALVLACTSAGGAGGASYPLHELAGLAESERLNRQLVLSDVRRDPTWRTANPDRWAALLEAASQGRPALSAEEAAEHEAGFRAQLDARRHHDAWERLPVLDLPVLVAGGRHDGIAPPANQEALAQRIPGADLMMFDGGHLFMMQDRTAYPAMIRWLQTHG
jgi:3-oxoadipate enol-lactonase